MMNPQRILLILVARIGDTLLGTPAIRALKAHYPTAEITVLAHPKRMEVLRNLPFIDHLAAITPRRAWWRHRLFGRQYDLALVYGNDRPLIQMALRAADRVIAFAQGMADADDPARLIQVPRPPKGAPIHAVSERLLLAEAAGAAPAAMPLAYCVTADEAAWAKAWLRRQLSGEPHPLIGLQPFSFPTKAHRDWPLASFQQLIERLRLAYPAVHFLVFGDQVAKARGQSLAQSCAASLTLCAGDFTLRQSAALMSQVDLYIGVDTGPTHIAGALGIPLVALYHCAYPGRYLMPLDHPALRAIEHPLTGTSRSNEESMADISVDAVFQAADELLSRRAPNGAEGRW